jgi:ring-1,2-phenylacetyl-CoA epoxidase subunit PaaD
VRVETERAELERSERAERAVASVADPELPMLTLADLGVVRSVELEDERVVVTLTPTYTGCPAFATIKADVRLALAREGFEEVELRTALTPAWSTEWLSEEGRRALHQHGIAPPAHLADGQGSTVDLVLMSKPAAPECPRCGAAATREVSRFGASACTSFHVCRACGEPFDRMREL